MSETDLAEVWARSLDELATMQIEPHQRAWLKLTRPLGLVENTALIATPNEFVKEQLETRLRALITHALSRELGRSIQLAVTVDPTGASPRRRPSPPLRPSRARAAARPRGQDDRRRDARACEAGPMDGAPDGRRPAGPADPLGSGSLGQHAVPRAAPGLGTGSRRAIPGHRPADGQPGHPDRPAAARTAARGRLAGSPGRALRCAGRPAAARGRAARAAARRAPAHPGPAQSQVHVRDVRDRLEQPLRARRRGRGRRGAGQGLQPALHLRRLRPRQDPSAARHRPLRAEPLPRA